MNLRDLEPWLIRYARRDGREIMQHVESLADAQGLVFLCPLCRETNGHSIGVWFRDRGVPDEATPKGRWGVSGTSLDDLTLAPSIHITTGCGWHGFIRAGQIVTC